MANTREPVLQPIPILSLRPTQMTVGMREVKEKRKRWREHKLKKQGELLGKHQIPVVSECPLYLVVGTADRLVDWRDGERLAAEASGPVELQIVEGGNHIANNKPHEYRLRSADWMAAQLGVPKS